MRSNTHWMAVGMVLVLGLTVRAAEMPPQVAAYVNQQTQFLAGADITRADPVAAFDWVQQKLQAAAPDIAATMQPHLDRSRDNARNWREGFLDAGGTSIYLLGSSPDPDVVSRMAPIIVVPLADRADAERLAKLLPRNEFGKMLRLPDRLVCVGPGSPDGMLDQFAAAARPDLTAALASIGDLPAYCLMAFSREVKEEAMRQGEHAPPLMQPLVPHFKTLSEMDWAIFAATTDPAPRMKAVVQAPDEATAQRMHQALVELKRIAEQPAQGAHERTVLLMGTFSLLDGWQQQGEQLVLDADAERLAQIAAGPLAAAMGRAEATAQRTRRMSDVRQLMVACVMYYDDNKAWPRTWDDVVNSLVVQGPAAINVEGLTLITPKKPFESIKNPSKVIAIHEAYDPWPAEGVIAGFVDGHTELIADETRFLQLLRAGGD